MAKMSLQEQLLKSGLVGAGQAKAVKLEKHKQAKQQQHNKTVVVDDLKEHAQQARLEKAEKDRELNQRRKQEDERKQIAAQIKQLIDQNRLPQGNGLAEDECIPYHFTDNNKVKTLYISAETREKLIKGQLAIVKSDTQYDVIPIETAEKIKVRDESFIVALNTRDFQVANKEDPYADYHVPDDLMW